MSVVAALSAVVIFAGLVVLQIALVAGAPLGRFAWGGQNDVLPTRTRVGSALAVVLYLVFSLVLLGRAGSIELLPEIVVRVGAWVLFGYLVLGIVLNAISRSKAERYLMVPVTVVLAALTFVVALG